MGTGETDRQKPYITLWLQESPPAVVKEPLWVIIDGLHDLDPVQALNTLRVADVTGAAKNILCVKMISLESQPSRTAQQTGSCIILITS